MDNIPGLSNMPTLAGLTWYQLIGLGLVGVAVAKVFHAAVKTAVTIGVIIVIATLILKTIS